MLVPAARVSAPRPRPVVAADPQKVRSYSPARLPPPIPHASWPGVLLRLELDDGDRKAHFGAGQALHVTKGVRNGRAITEAGGSMVLAAKLPVDLGVELDRRRAIEEANAWSASRDVVLIVGRGHEVVQHQGPLAVPLDDREAARNALAIFADQRAGGWDDPCG